jgi:hypothetical protein
MNSEVLVKQVLEAHNQLRQNPQFLIPHLQKMLPLFEGTLFKEPGKVNINTQEGANAVQELINFLKN